MPPKPEPANQQNRDTHRDVALEREDHKCNPFVARTGEDFHGSNWAVQRQAQPRRASNVSHAAGRTPGVGCRGLFGGVGFISIENGREDTLGVGTRDPECPIQPRAFEAHTKGALARKLRRKQPCHLL